MTSGVEIVEVSARDGLQSEPGLVSTADKVRLITAAIGAGARRLEVCSFVNPHRVPQMADAEAVLAALPGGMAYSGLVLNERGFERALASGLAEVNVVIPVTDTFSRRNQGSTTGDGLAAFERIAPRARTAGVRTTVTLACAFGCPYEGEVPVGRVATVAARVAAAGADELSLADTIGVAVPTDVSERVEAVTPHLGQARLRAHFHNTRNTGLANAATAVAAGVRILDASLGGIGGCPFAPNATGNIPTEDLVYMLSRMGYRTGLDLAALIDAVPLVEELVGRRVPGLLSKAGPFPA